MKLIAWVLSATAALIFVGYQTAPKADDRANCDVFAGTPGVNQANRIIYGQGSRGPACTSGVQIRVRLRKDISFWFDTTLVDLRRSGTNFDVNVQYHCTGNGSERIYIQVDAPNRQVESQRVSVNYCS